MPTTTASTSAASTKAAFFSVNTDSILSAVHRMTGTANELGDKEVLTCLAQCAGVCSSVSEDAPVSTHGVPSVVARTGLGKPETERAHGKLQQAGLLGTAPDAPPGTLPRHVSTTYTVHAAERPDLRLSASLFQRQGLNWQWPLESAGHLFHKMKCSPEIPLRVARLDALCVLLYLHRHQDFSEYSGVDPLIAHGECLPIQEGPNNTFMADIKPLVGHPDWCVVTVCKSPVNQLSPAAADEALATVDPARVDATKIERFTHALKELRRLNLIHDVMVIWDRHPASGDGMLSPCVWGTLDAGKCRNEQLEKQLKEATRKVVFGTKTLDRVEHLGHHSPRRADPQGMYHYLVPSHLADTAVLLVQYRVRQWADDDATLRALAMDANRVAEREEEMMRLVCI